MQHQYNQALKATRSYVIKRFLTDLAEMKAVSYEVFEFIRFQSSATQRD
jgi:hypothetical protein